MEVPLTIRIGERLINNKTDVERIPGISRNLARALKERRTPTFAQVKSRCRANEGAFSSTLIALGASDEEVKLLVSLVRRSQTLPPPRSQKDKAKASKQTSA